MADLSKSQQEVLLAMYQEAINISATWLKKQLSSIPFHQDAEARSGWRHWQALGSSQIMVCPSRYKSFCLAQEKILRLDISEEKRNILLKEFWERELSPE